MIKYRPGKIASTNDAIDSKQPKPVSGNNSSRGSSLGKADKPAGGRDLGIQVKQDLGVQVKESPAEINLDLEGYNKKRKTMDTVEAVTVASL